ncbi:MAG TPA: thiol reductant ABC exporter subunit CydC [Anaerolineaceae bacterium]|nr:thiol reductant ABC exporter subunit CydC [Anaerolineaceae bacterium]
MNGLRRLFAILREFTGEVLLSLLLGVAAIAAGIGLLGTSAYLISSAALKPSIAELQVAIVGVRFFGISRGVFRYLERLVSHSVNLRVLTRLREDFYRRVEPGAPANLAAHRSGEILDRVMGDLETLENFYVRVVAPAVVALVIITGVSFFVGGYALRLGLILALGLLIGGFLHPALTAIVSKSHIQNLARSKADTSARLVEVLQGLEDLQVYNAQDRYFGSLLKAFQLSGNLQKRLLNISVGSSGLALLITNLTVLTLLWTAIPLVGDGEFTGISLAVITLVAIASFEAVTAMPAAALNLNASAVAAARLFSIGDGAIRGRVGAVTPDLISCPELILDGVSFTYPEGDHAVLAGLDFALKPGCKIAIVGASGAGKTSLVNLLMSFAQPQTGSIRINGVDLRDADPEWSRSMFSVLPQSAYLFNDSVRGNLLLAKTDADDKELICVLEEVDLLDWYHALPDGLDSWIGEHGVRMSGGERQRLAIARLLLQDRPFVVLDEPTASLDRVTARKVMESINTRTGDKGMLLITYDLDLLKGMDEILVISDGRITQRGTLIPLLEMDGVFRDLFDLENNRIRDS